MNQRAGGACAIPFTLAVHFIHWLSFYYYFPLYLYSVTLQKLAKLSRNKPRGSCRPYRTPCRWRASLGRTSTKSYHTTMEHSLAPADKHAQHLVTDLFVSGIPLLAWKVIINLLCLEASTAAGLPKGIKLHTKICGVLVGSPLCLWILLKVSRINLQAHSYGNHCKNTLKTLTLCSRKREGVISKLVYCSKTLLSSYSDVLHLEDKAKINDSLQKSCISATDSSP